QRNPVVASRSSNTTSPVIWIKVRMIFKKKIRDVNDSQDSIKKPKAQFTVPEPEKMQDTTVLLGKSSKKSENRRRARKVGE
ncbi:10048_t:CDS:2, partial [Paraglomus occultum]